MSVAVYQNQKPKEDPMAKALQIMQVANLGSDLASKSGGELQEEPVAPPQKPETAMERLYRKKQNNIYGDVP